MILLLIHCCSELKVFWTEFTCFLLEKLREIIHDCRSGVNRQTVKIITKILNSHPKPRYYMELSKLESCVISLCGKITQAGLDQEHYLSELESLLKGSLFKIHPHVVKVDADPKSNNFTDKVVENIYKRKLVRIGLCICCRERQHDAFHSCHLLSE